MSGLGIVVAALGVLIILTRGPLIFAPVATLQVYRRLLGSTLGMRVLGVAVLGMGLTLIAVSEGSEGQASSIANTAGWLFASAAIVFFIILPNVLRSFAESMLDMIDDVARPIGVLAVALGLVFVWLGVAVL